MPTRRGIPHEQTKEALRNICVLGAELRTAIGVSDIAGGRSWLLTVALEAAEEQGRDTILMVDDDMVFTPAQAVTLVEYTRAHGVPASAVYVASDGNLCGRRYKHGKWYTGLGFAAVPVKVLRALADTLPRGVWTEEHNTIYAFCESRMHVNDRGIHEWLSEDYDFCRKLGGMQLLPIAVGHIKPIPLYAPQADVERLTSD